jgi:hypothetical protein
MPNECGSSCPYIVCACMKRLQNMHRMNACVRAFVRPLRVVRIAELSRDQGS